MSRVSFELRREAGSLSRVVVRVTVIDPALVGHQATLALERHVLVKDGRAVNSSVELARRPLRLTAEPAEVRFDLGDEVLYDYDGGMIDIAVHTKLVVDDGWLWDTKLSAAHDLGLGLFDTAAPTDATLIEPADTYDLAANLAALPPGRRAMVSGVLAFGGLVLAALSALGLHDTFGLTGPPLVFSETGLGPGIATGVGGVFGGLGLWGFLKWQLRRYCTLSLRSDLPRLGPQTKLAVRDLLQGTATVALDGARLRVVACNMECGQYRRGSGTKVRTVSFREPARTVLLYDQVAGHLPAGAPIEEAFGGEVDFGPLFFTTLPPQFAGSSHGLVAYWEVQLLHDTLVDQELVGPPELLDYGAMWGAP